MPDLRLTVLTPGRTILGEQPIDSFRVLLSDGSPLSIYPRHAALVARLSPEKAQYWVNGASHGLFLGEGVIRVFNNRITCAVEEGSILTGGKDG